MTASTAATALTRSPHRRTFVRVAQVMAAVSVLLSLSVIVFVVRTELAHRESVCPFHDIGRREVAPGVSILERARRCEAAVEEHRFILERTGQPPRIFGDRRLPTAFFQRGKYRWRAAMEKGQVVLHIQNDGVEAAEFQERPPEKHR